MSSSAVAVQALDLESPPRRGYCLFCSAELKHTFVDLGMSPLCESYRTAEQRDHMEPFYPLHVFVCDQCWLVQLQEYVSGAEIFTEYAYFSAFSRSWLEHCRRYTELMVERFALDEQSRVVEVGSNDGYLLQYFVERGIPALGVEPAANVARVAIEQRKVPTEVAFFGRDTARRLLQSHGAADLLLGNNVMAQVPDLNDFVAGLKLLLAADGVITIEFPHLMKLVEGVQYDTIYHEHYSYFSFLTVQQLFAAHGLTVFDVDELPTHGGSLRIYAQHGESGAQPTSERVHELAARERAAGVASLEYYRDFGERVKESKRALLEFLINARRAGKTVVGYGAPGKGNTLLNYCGIRTDFLDFTVDRNEYKQGKFLPGTHIPIYEPERIDAVRPDYVLILPWNIQQEIVQQLAHIRSWGGKFVVPIPAARVIE